MRLALFAVVQFTEDKEVNIVVPDLNITQHGKTFADALSSIIMVVEAIHEYNAKRGIRIEVKTTYDDVVALCRDGTEDFPTCLGMK